MSRDPKTDAPHPETALHPEKSATPKNRRESLRVPFVKAFEAYVLVRNVLREAEVLNISTGGMLLRIDLPKKVLKLNTPYELRLYLAPELFLCLPFQVQAIAHKLPEGESLHPHAFYYHCAFHITDPQIQACGEALVHFLDLAYHCAHTAAATPPRIPKAA